MEHNRKRPTTKGPSEWFTGDVWIDTVAQGHGGSPLTRFRTLQPRSAHRVAQPLSAQTLYVTEGEGRA